MGNRCNHPGTPVIGISAQSTKSEPEHVPIPDRDHSTTKEHSTESLSTSATQVRNTFFTNTVVQPWSKAEPHHQSESAQHAECNDLRRCIDERDQEIESLRQQLRDKDQLILEVQETVKSLRQELLQLHQTLQGKLVLNWMEKVEVSTESTMQRGSAAAVGSVVFFNPRSTNTIYTYESFGQDWSELEPHCPNYNFSLVAVDDQLTAVGGSRQENTPGNVLLTFVDGEWTERFPSMSVRRENPAAVYAGQSLVVAGGCSEDPAASVEVLNARTLQWQTASCLLNQNGVTLNPASMVVCGDNIYAFNGNKRTHAFTCSFSTLLESCSQNDRDAGDFEQDSVCAWHRVSDVPVSQSTAVTLCGHLVCVGGYEDSAEVDTVYSYDPATDEWTKLGSLMSPKGLPLTAILPGEKLVVVYENYDRSFVGTATVIDG